MGEWEGVGEDLRRGGGSGAGYGERVE